MDERALIQLSTERDKGSRAQYAYDDFVAPFIEAKEAVLIEAFRVCEMRDEEGLIKIKMQFSAIDALKAEMLGYIETGKLASTTLDQAEAEAKVKRKEEKE